MFLSANVSDAQIGIYGANYRIGSVVLTFIAAPIAMSWVSIAQRAPETAGARAREWAAGYTAVCVVVVGVLMLATTTIVPVIFGSGFRGDVLVVGLVGAAGWLGGLHPLIATRALLSESTLRLSLLTLPVAVLALVLNAVLIPAYGTDGAVYATFAAYAALCVSAAIAVRPRS